MERSVLFSKNGLQNDRFTNVTYRYGLILFYVLALVAMTTVTTITFRQFYFLTSKSSEAPQTILLCSKTKVSFYHIAQITAGFNPESYLQSQGFSLPKYSAQNIGW